MRTRISPAAAAIVVVVLLLLTSYPFLASGSDITVPVQQQAGGSIPVPASGISGPQGVSNASTVKVMNDSVGNGSTVPPLYAVYPDGGGYSFGAVPTATSIRYPVVSPYSISSYNGTVPFEGPFQNVSTSLPPYAFQGSTEYDAEFATSLHWAANFTKIYPPAIMGQYSGGIEPNYSLQFNVPFYSTIPGGETYVNWYQAAFGFYRVSGSNNSHDANDSYLSLIHI